MAQRAARPPQMDGYASPARLTPSVVVAVAPSDTVVVGFGDACQVRLDALAPPPPPGAFGLAPSQSRTRCLTFYSAASSQFTGQPAHAMERVTMVAHNPNDVVVINGRCAWRRGVPVCVRDGDRVQLYVPASATTYSLTVRCADKAAKYVELFRVSTTSVVPSTVSTARCDDACATTSGHAEGLPPPMQRDGVDGGANLPFRPVSWGPSGPTTSSHLPSLSESIVGGSPTTSDSPGSSVRMGSSSGTDTSLYNCSQMGDTLRSPATGEWSASTRLHGQGNPHFTAGSFSHAGDKLDEDFARHCFRGRRNGRPGAKPTGYVLNPRAVTAHHNISFITTPIMEVHEPPPDDPLLHSMTRLSFSFPACLTPRGYESTDEIATAHGPDTLQQCARCIIDMLSFAYQTRTNAFHYFSEAEKQRLRRCTVRVVDHLASVAGDQYRPVLHLSTPLFCCGDVLGNFADVHQAYGQVCYLQHFATQHTPILFLGNYVGKGDYSVEVVLWLLAWRLLRPDAVHLLRGNFEDREVNGDIAYLKGRSFKKQCREFSFDTDKGDALWAKLSTVLEALPVAAVIDGNVFACHGGVPMLSAAPESEFPLPSAERIAAVPHNNKVHRARVRTEQDGLLPTVTPSADGTILADYFYVAIPSPALFCSMLKAGEGEAGSDAARAFLFPTLGMRDDDTAEVAVRRRLVRELVWNDELTDFANMKKPTFTRAPCVDKWRLLENADGSGAGPADLRLSLIKYSALRPKGDSLKLFLALQEPAPARAVDAAGTERRTGEEPTPAAPTNEEATSSSGMAAGPPPPHGSDRSVPARSSSSVHLSTSSACAVSEVLSSPSSSSRLSLTALGEALVAAEAAEAAAAEARAARGRPTVRLSAILNGQRRNFPIARSEAERVADGKRVAEEAARALRGIQDVDGIVVPMAALDKLPPPRSPGPSHVNLTQLSVVSFSAVMRHQSPSPSFATSDDEEDEPYVEFPWQRRQRPVSSTSSSCVSTTHDADDDDAEHAAPAGAEPHRGATHRARTCVHDPFEYTVTYDEQPRTVWHLQNAMRKARKVAGLPTRFANAGTTVTASGFRSNYRRGDHQGVIRQFTTAAATQFLDEFHFELLLHGNTSHPAGVHVSGERRIVSLFTHSYYSPSERSRAGACLLQNHHIQLLAWRTRHRPRNACIYKDSMGCFLHEQSMSIDEKLLTDFAVARRRAAADLDSEGHLKCVTEETPIEIVLDPTKGFDLVIDPENRHVGFASDPSRPINFICLNYGDDPRREQYGLIWSEEDAREAIVAEEVAQRALVREAQQGSPRPPSPRQTSAAQTLKGEAPACPSTSPCPCSSARESLLLASTTAPLGSAELGAEGE